MNTWIIVIDDSLVVRKVLETCVRRAGFQVQSFADGVAALRWCRWAQTPVPAFVLIDLILPGLDGYEVIRLLKANPRLEHTRFVIISGRDGVLDRIKGRLAGAHAYLTKPFKTQDVRRIVQSPCAAHQPGGYL